MSALGWLLGGVLLGIWLQSWFVHPYREYRLTLCRELALEKTWRRMKVDVLYVLTMPSELRKKYKRGDFL